MEDSCPACTDWKYACEAFYAEASEMYQELKQLKQLYDGKCDQMKEVLLISGKMRLLLSEKEIEHEY